MAKYSEDASLTVSFFLAIVLILLGISFLGKFLFEAFSGANYYLGHIFLGLVLLAPGLFIFKRLWVGEEPLIKISRGGSWIIGSVGTNSSEEDEDEDEGDDGGE